MVRVPATVSEVDAAWVAEATGWSVDGVEVDPIGAGEGFMGRLARLRLSSDDPSVPPSVVLKLATDDPGGVVMGQMMRVWEREHRFYDEVAPLLTIRAPKAHLNVLEPPCLVLEDLSPATPGDHVAGATEAQAFAAVEALARHHAHWFEHPLLDTLTWMPSLHDPMIAMFGTTFEMGWPAFVDRYGDELPSRCLTWCEQFMADLDRWIETHYADPVTLCHGDFRLDNIFFGADGSVSVIDWQMAMRVPGQSDFVYFCANNLTVDDRRAHEHGLLRAYVDTLHANGVAPDAVTLDGVWRGYLEGLVFFACGFGGGLLSIDPANARGAALFDALVRRTFAAMDDLAAGEVIGLGT
jgi:hypothetical protein